MIPIVKNAEVQSAETEGRPIVALESTIVTHGLPWPQNLETAHLVEDTVRAAGATPATIAIIQGRIHIGLERQQLEAMAQAKNVYKLSRADLAARMALGQDGSTTVAATMICARLAGIDIFATGGIGGVHRGAETSFDISADLDELAQTPVTVVSAGAKAILDLPMTVEALETRGVPVIGWQTDEFPAFWSRKSGLACPIRMDHAEDIANAHRVRKQLAIPGGQLVANPIPPESEIPNDIIDPVIEDALKAAARDGVSGKDVTPYLLSRVLEATEGKSLEANVALIRNNARLAAEIATALIQQSD